MLSVASRFFLTTDSHQLLQQDDGHPGRNSAPDLLQFQVQLLHLLLHSPDLPPGLVRTAHLPEKQAPQGPADRTLQCAMLAPRILEYAQHLQLVLPISTKAETWFDSPLPEMLPDPKNSVVLARSSKSLAWMPGRQCVHRSMHWSRLVPGLQSKRPGGQ